MDDCCNICVDDFDKNQKRQKIECPLCNYAICRTCAETYMTSSKSPLTCCNCNRGFSTIELHQMELPHVFIEGIVRDHRSIPTRMEQQNRYISVDMPRFLCNADLHRIDEEYNVVVKIFIEQINVMLLLFARVKHKQKMLRREAIAYKPTPEMIRDAKSQSFVCPYTDCQAHGGRLPTTKGGICSACKRYVCVKCRLPKSNRTDKSHTCPKITPLDDRLTAMCKVTNDIKNKIAVLTDARNLLQEKRLDLCRHTRILDGERYNRKTAKRLEYFPNESTSEARIAVPKPIMPCPLDSCQGYVMSVKWTCNACQVNVCAKCWELKRARVDDEHVCKDEDVATVNMLTGERGSNRCPRCTTWIYKINGCSQMHCVICKTTYNEPGANGEMKVIQEIIDGKLVTHGRSAVHNPEAVRWLRDEVGINNRLDNPEDRCGGVPRHQDVSREVINRWNEPPMPPDVIRVTMMNVFWRYKIPLKIIDIVYKHYTSIELFPFKTKLTERAFNASYLSLGGPPTARPRLPIMPDIERSVAHIRHAIEHDMQTDMRLKYARMAKSRYENRLSETQWRREIVLIDREVECTTERRAVMETMCVVLGDLAARLHAGEITIFAFGRSLDEFEHYVMSQFDMINKVFKRTGCGVRHRETSIWKYLVVYDRV